MEDLIPDEELVVSITRGGYAKRTRADQYRTQKRGRARACAARRLRGDDVVEHFIATTTTTGCCSSPRPAGLPHQGLQPARGCARRQGRPRRGLLSFQPDEDIAQVLAIRDYEQAPTSCSPPATAWSRRPGSATTTARARPGVIAINFREDDDELIGAELVNADDDILLVSVKGQSIRFKADDEQLRPMGRATGGVRGMKFRDGDSLLSMSVIRPSRSPPRRPPRRRPRQPVAPPRPRTSTSRSSTSSRSPTPASPSAAGSATTGSSRAAASASRR
jgi:DNA gyrase subunit A